MFHLTFAAYSARAVTGLQSYPEDFTITGFPPTDDPAINARVPEIDPDYVFSKAETEKVITYLDQPMKDALWIFGPKGCGKTTLPEQIAARLRWPVSSFSVGKKFEPNDLLGHPILMKGEWAYQYNPLSIAYRDGHILIINEAAQFDPYQTSFLHDVMERKPLVLVNNGGEIIRPHPMFRLVFTANSGGRGDMSGLYQGDERLNSALLDRVRYIKADYPRPEVETDILVRKIPDLAQVGNGAIVSAMVQAANDIREAFKNDQLPEPVSTRTLVRWGYQILFNFGAENAVVEALDVAFTAAFDDEERESYVKVVENRFGSDVIEAIANA